MKKDQSPSTQPGHTDICLWLDYYGDLLTARQKEVLGLYYDMDWSLSEIAEETGLSRQGVHDQIRRGTGRLALLEDILGLASRDRLLHQLLDQAMEAQARADDQSLLETLDRLRLAIKLTAIEEGEERETHGPV